jgi:hypothetical protein
MKKLPLLLVSMLVMSSAAFAETPVERQRLTVDGIGMQQTQARPVMHDTRANNYDNNAQMNNDMQKEKRMHHKKHRKAKKDEANKVEAEKVKK